MHFFYRILTLLIVVVLLYLWTKIIHVISNQQTAILPKMKNHKEEPNVSINTSDKFLYVQQLRKKRLREFCPQHPELSRLESVHGVEDLLSRMIVNEKLQIVYCKAGTSGMDLWENLLQKIKRRDDVTIETPVIDNNVLNSSLVSKQQTSYNLTMVENIFRTYTKVVFVREPFERLVSVYTQGFAGEMTFSDLLEDVLDTIDDDMFRPIVTLCHPCFVKYDYIVMHDFLRTEVFYLMKRIGLPDYILQPEFSDTQSKMTHKWLMENLFRGLTRQQIKQLAKVYSLDIEAFNFHKSLLLKNYIGRFG
ncbi:carbohydrate sulfotransferase 9-like [Pelobates cultripes]|uniref:Carbohydrate sulfotransferase n=2 Tax=Pelobates cultripes TaxID=61616 RepID=A0AAD1RIW7_PELCU|nr:carbohydrate sulfotransferase 9-like [Pelobates cultripes]